MSPWHWWQPARLPCWAEGHGAVRSTWAPRGSDRWTQSPGPTPRIPAHANPHLSKRSLPGGEALAPSQPPHRGTTGQESLLLEGMDAQQRKKGVTKSMPPLSGGRTGPGSRTACDRSANWHGPAARAHRGDAQAASSSAAPATGTAGRQGEQVGGHLWAAPPGHRLPHCASDGFQAPMQARAGQIHDPSVRRTPTFQSPGTQGIPMLHKCR